MDYKFGAIQSPADHRDILYRAVIPVQAVPRKYSRRIEMGPVRNQGSFGSCVAFASSGVKDNQERRECGSDIQTSPLYIYKRCKQLDGIPSQEGTYPRIAMKVLTDYGVCPEQAFPYTSMSWPIMPNIPSDADKRALQYKIGAYASIGTIGEIKQAIVNSGPVLGALVVYDNFMSPLPGGIIDMPKGNVCGGHAVCVVGFSDDMSANGHIGYLEIRNSWDKYWGDGGYCWIPYDFFAGRSASGQAYWYESWSSVDIILPPTACKDGYLFIGKNYALIDGVEVPLDSAPFVDSEKSRTMVPMRFMAENMGYKVEWNQLQQSIHFYRPGV